MDRVKFSLLCLCATLAAAMTVQPGWAQSGSASQQDPSNPPTATQSSPSTSMDPSAQAPMDAQTFTGKITKSGGKYVLKDETTRTTYALDDQNQAKSFEGKSVKVTGKLDTSSNTIQVATIEPGS
jgi:hypothetical protein